jgi:ribosomal protein S25
MLIDMSIGTHNESSLHRDLKFRYAGQDGETEAKVAGFVADGINAEGEYFEIQIGSFGPLKKKALALQGRLRVIHPIIITKYIEVYNKRGKLQYRRKSPRRGQPWDLFNVLVYSPDLPLIPGLVIELALVDAAEQRVQDGKGSWRRKGVSIRDRQILVFHTRITLEKPSDYIRFVPFKKKEKFTSALLAQKAGISVDLARKTLYVLTKIGIVKKIGKQGNALVYKR